VAARSTHPNILARIAMAERKRRLNLGWLGPSGAGTGASVARRSRVLLVLALVLANLIGACIVFFLANFVIPVPDLDDETQVRIANLLAFVAYVVLAIVVGIAWGTKRMLPLWKFLSEERDPTPEERPMLLRGPLRITLVIAVLWAVPIALFGALNLVFDPVLAVSIAATVAVGGLATCAVAYLLSERILRAAASRAMAAGAPEEPATPGVAARLLIAWVLGTALPLVGVVLVSIYALTGDDVSRTELGLTALVLSCLVLVFGFLISVLTSRAIADPITSVRQALSRIERGDLDAEVPVYDGSELGLLQAGFNRTVEGLRERERIRETFGAYVDRDVAEHVLKEGPSLEGDEVEVTLMFLDVRDFTGFAEKSDAKDVVSTLNELFELAVPIVREHGGHVDKFVGDGLLAVFGAPRPAADHADRALAAACEIANAVSERFGDRLQIGIGLNSGRVVAGNIGGAGRLEFSVIGDAVNVASRVEAATRDTGDAVLLSEETRARLRNGDVELEERPGLELKGKSGSVTLHAAK
jgi:adenylate cyclase